MIFVKTFMRAIKLIFLVLLLGSIVSCDKANISAVEDIQKKLIGTWLSETDFEGSRIRSVSSLDQDGVFREFEKSIDLEGKSIETSYVGGWAFDGVNFKRKYTSKNGLSLSNSKFEYATYAIKMSGNDEFIGVNNIERKILKFTRVGADVRP